jgi:pimeloyl-ACP methyl ester carboxylesterase
MSGTWSTEDIDGPADVYEPAKRPRLAVLYLHDIDGHTLRDRPTFTRVFAEFGLGCVCPQRGPCWWVDRSGSEPRITPARSLLNHVVPYFQQRWGIDPRAIGLLGVGMGGQGALRLAFQQPKLFPVVAGISSAIDYYELYGQGTPLDDLYDSKEQCRQDTAPLHVHPSEYPPHIFFAVDPEDRWYRGNDRLHEKLSALGIPHEIDVTISAGGHSSDYVDRMAERVVRFIYAGLVHEGRRLL